MTGSADGSSALSVGARQGIALFSVILTENTYNFASLVGGRAVRAPEIL